MVFPEETGLCPQLNTMIDDRFAPKPGHLEVLLHDPKPALKFIARAIDLDKLGEPAILRLKSSGLVGEE